MFISDEVAFFAQVVLDSKSLYVQIFSISSYFKDITDSREV